MKPERYVRAPERFEPLRTHLNRALLFTGLVVQESGLLEMVEQVQTLSEAARRANELRADLTSHVRLWCWHLRTDITASSG